MASLKDQFFNPGKVSYLAGLIAAAYPEFPSSAFQEDVVALFPEQELKERLAHMTTCLHQHLPDDYLTALAILLRALPEELDPTQSDDDFGDFIFAPLSLFVARYGCLKEYLNISLNALKEMTKRFSAEYAIRFFLNEFPEETIAYLTTCARDENYHVRRWASEGTRPKLPWAQGLSIGWEMPLPILELLYCDPTRFVTRSVANHLNDISKLEPEVVVETLRRWQESKAQSEKEMDFLTRHSLRTLVKKGHSGALEMLGFGAEPNITITDFYTTTPTVKVGEVFEFCLVFSSHETQHLLIDYLMEFASDRKRRGKKVFKLKQLEAKEGSSKSIKKKHPMRLMTTRRLVLGEHKVTLKINGKTFDSLSFELVE